MQRVSVVRLGTARCVRSVCRCWLCFKIPWAWRLSPHANTLTRCCLCARTKRYHLKVAATDASAHCPHASLFGASVCVAPAATRRVSFCESYNTTCGDTKLGDAYADCKTDVQGMDLGMSGAQTLKDTFSCREVGACVLIRASACTVARLCVRSCFSPPCMRACKHVRSRCGGLGVWR